MSKNIKPIKFEYYKYSYKKDYDMIQHWLDTASSRNMDIEDYDMQVNSLMSSKMFDNCLAMLVCIDNYPAASVIITTKGSNATIYDIIVNNEIRGCGVGTALLKDIALKINGFGFKNKITSIDAGIKINNDASLYAFIDAGFKLKDTSENYLVKIDNLEEYYKTIDHNNKIKDIFIKALNKDEELVC